MAALCWGLPSMKMRFSVGTPNSVILVPEYLRLSQHKAGTNSYDLRELVNCDGQCKSSGLAVGGLGSSLGSPMILLCDIGPVPSPLKRSDGACRMLFQPGWTGLHGGGGWHHLLA